MESLINFIDIHSHILPEIDDGAKEIEESLTMIKGAGEVGTKKIVLTPHIYHYDIDRVNNIAKQFDILMEIVLERRIDVDLLLGAELMLHPELSAWIRDDKRLTLNGNGRYALIELPLFVIPIYAPNVFCDLLTHGITPIWAHPERCAEVMDDYRIVGSYVNNGVILQINAGSLLGIYGKRVRDTATKLIKEDLGSVLASDAHRIDDTKRLLPEAFLNLVKMIGRAKASDMVLSSLLNILI